MQVPRSEDGAVATEYVFLLVFVALAVAVGAVAYGSALSGRFDGASTTITESIN